MAHSECNTIELANSGNRVAAPQRTATLKLLVVIASYGLNQDKYMERLVREYQSMSFQVDVVVVSNVEKSVPEGVKLVVGMPTKDPWSLPFAHKQVMAERINDYDLFVYSENDTLLTEKHVEAFLRVSQVLPENEIPGFLRYESNAKGVRQNISAHGHYHWDSASVCKRGSLTFGAFTNEHAALFLITQKQLRAAIASGHFLVAPYKGKYDLACTAATDPYNSCGFRKLVCISQLDDFLLHHLPDKYTGPEFTEADQEFGKQLKALMALAESGRKPASLFPTETKLPAAKFSKDYYEQVREEIASMIPESARSVLSLGTGLGKTEKWLAGKGKRVVAVPLDPVIGAAAQAEGVEILEGSFDAVRKVLEGRKFDCLFLSNILHLAPQPQEVLKRFAELLQPGGSILIVSPNLGNLKYSLKRVRGEVGFRDLGSYEMTGVHRVTSGAIRRWLRESGCKIETAKWSSSPRFRQLVDFFPGLIGAFLGSEMIVLAKKS